MLRPQGCRITGGVVKFDTVQKIQVLTDALTWLPGSIWMPEAQFCLVRTKNKHQTQWVHCFRVSRDRLAHTQQDSMTLGQGREPHIQRNWYIGIVGIR